MNNDLISRSALLEALRKESILHRKAFHIDTKALIQHEEEFSACMRVVCSAPAVDTEVVRHGRWIIEWKTTIDYCTGEYDEEPTAICPFCDHRDYGSAYDDSYWGRPWRYCPNCGAKMDGDVNATY